MSNRVICERRNASQNINGIPFEPYGDSGHMISVEPLDDEVVERFLRIPGYRVEVDDSGAQEAEKAPRRGPGRKKQDQDKAPELPIAQDGADSSKEPPVSDDGADEKTENSKGGE